MKKIILTFVLFLSAINLFSQSDPNWRWIHPRPQGQYIEFLKMIDANNWIAIADYGNFLRTTDAGATWRTSTGGYPYTSYPGAGIYQNFRCAYFFNANTGYLGVQAVAGIAKTTNGGLTFDTLRILASGTGTTYGITFLNSSTGYLCGTSTFKAMKTTNAGVNWTVLPNLGTTTLYCIYAADTNNIKLGTTSGNVLITTDAGATWTTSNVGTTNTIYGVKFANVNTGYVCGSSGLVRYTTNGGVNWSGTSVPSTSSMYNIVIDGPDVYVSGTSSTSELYKSTDNGTTWTSISYVNGPSITGFYAYGFDKVGSTMLLGGSYGELIKSTNNGANWTSLMYRSSMANLTDLYANRGNGRVIAIGVNNGTPDVIMYSSDGGSTWNTANYTASDYLNTINMLNANTGFVSGRWGRFAKTTDGGVTWDTSKTANPTLLPYFCNGVSFINENTGWIAGGTPSIGGVTKIWKTTDGGSNWTEQVSAYSGPVGVKIQMLNENFGYLTCGAALQRTTNGGVNWTLMNTPGPGSYSPLEVLDTSTVYTGSSNSQLYATTNGGYTWDSLNFPVKAGTIFCTDWYNSQIGCAGAVIGVVGKTTNRGQSWQMFNTGGYTIMALQMVHPDTIFAVAGNTAGAQIFKYAKGLTSAGFEYEHVIPTDYSLKQNYPNPFNPVTTIEFDIPKQANVSIKIYDIAGREYRSEISNLNLAAGKYKMNFDGSRLSSGIYFYSLVVNGSNAATNKMMLVK